jgi:hypothetical protein
MAMKIKMILAVLCALSVWQAKAQNYDTNGDYVQTFAGSSFSGYVDGVGQQTMFASPTAIVSDSHGNLFVWDFGNQRIRKITPDGTVSTFAGGGTLPTGVGTNVNFNNFYLPEMTIDRNDTIWMVGTPGGQFSGQPSILYSVTSSGVISITPLGYTTYAHVAGICVDSYGNLYIADTQLNKIFRYATNGVWTVFAGSGNAGHADGTGLFTSFNSPSVLAADSANNIYVWDQGNALIRRIDQNSNVTTLAGTYQDFGVGGATRFDADGTGTNASFKIIYDMCVDSNGNLILASDDGSIREMSASTNVVTLAGSFTQYGFTNGPGNLARFGGAASGVCIAGGTIYVADSANQRIRSITNNPTPQVVTGANLGIGTFTGVTITGIVGRTYEVQSSSDMNTWTTRATILLTASPYLWIDQNPVAWNRFYRAILLP